MKAARFSAPGGLERIRITDVADPGAPAAGEIRVRIHANSLNFHDFSVAMGYLPSEDGRILMSDGAGVVEAVGTDVQEFRAGDSVVSCFFPDWQDGDAPLAGFARTPGDGIDGYAVETVVRPASWFTHAPRNWTHAEAATLPTAALTAWRGLVIDGGLKRDDVVLLLGTGGVSIFGLQFAKMFGAKAIVTSSSDEKLERARKMGADHCINYKKVENWGAKVLELTGGRGVDQVVEVGGPGTLPQSMLAARIGGHIALIGVFTGIAGQVPTAMLMGKQLTLKGITVGSRSQQQELVRALDADTLRPVIDRRFALEQIAEAFTYEKNGQHFGKICLEY